MPRWSVGDDGGKFQRQDSGIPTGRPHGSNAQHLVCRVGVGFGEMKWAAGHRKSDVSGDYNLHWTTRTGNRHGGAEHQFYEGSTLVHLHLILQPFVLLHKNISGLCFTCVHYLTLLKIISMMPFPRFNNSHNKSRAVTFTRTTPNAACLLAATNDSLTGRRHTIGMPLPAEHRAVKNNQLKCKSISNAWNLASENQVASSRWALYRYNDRQNRNQ